MFNFQNILFPIAFSRREEAAAPFVLSMAQRYQARISVLHVLQPPPPVYAGMNMIYPEAFDCAEVLEDLRADLRKFAEANLPKAEVECVVESGDPADVISRYTKGKAVDVIAMPTHGYGIFRRALLGSVTAKVLHDSAIPVWTSAHVPEPSHRAHPQPRRILCALDMQPEGLVTLKAAISIASKAGASVLIVHVPAATVSPEVAERHMQDLLNRVAETELVEIRQAPPILHCAKAPISL
jgi:nucleotide-binding universal stress UspA family protein